MIKCEIVILDIEDYYKCNNIWDMKKQKDLADQFYQELIDKKVEKLN